MNVKIIIMGCGCNKGKKNKPTTNILKETLQKAVAESKGEPINIVAPVKNGKLQTPKLVDKATMDRVKKNQDARIKEHKEGVKPPSLMKRAFNFAKATKEYVKDGMQNVDKAIYIKRLEICKRCPIFNAEKGTCNKCGCFMEIKAKWKVSTCPDEPSRWPDPNIKVKEYGDN
tara:strand:- start:439 stop:954 length:516 start_codon:yes stop_codon:yes gene_type:complete